MRHAGFAVRLILGAILAVFGIGSLIEASANNGGTVFYGSAIAGLFLIGSAFWQLPGFQRWISRGKTKTVNIGTDDAPVEV